MKNFICDERTTVKTKAGAVKGFCLGTTYTFRGIQYAQAKRFEMPQPVEPWEGVKPALNYGPIAPSRFVETHDTDILNPHREYIHNETCQYLNVWTQSLDPGKKAPVMFWIHGGGHVMGSSIELEAFDGNNLSEYGDVVVVSINHRLNILGYLDLADYSEKFKHSANLGGMDIIAALQWVHDNIEAFGGDPSNVTIFGQSGGGHKVATMLQMAAADGLFHKCIIQSGVTPNFRYPKKGENGHAIVDAMLRELNIETKDIEKLQELSYEELAGAHDRVQEGLRKQWIYCGETPLPNDDYAGEGWEVGFRSESLNVPVMIGTVIAEFAFGVNLPNKHSMTEAEQEQVVRDRFGADADALMAAFRKAYPDKGVADLLYFESCIRLAGMRYASRRIADGGANVYNYVFSKEFPINGGQLAWHCAELPFSFHNVDRSPVANMGEISAKLEENMASAWVSFARTGAPTLKDGTEWKPYTDEGHETMIFDTECRLGVNFDDELLKLHDKAVPTMVMQV